MKRLVAAIVSVIVCACESQLTFVEYADGKAYSGRMQSSFLDEGRVSAFIDGVSYDGTWAIENSGSSINFGSVEHSNDHRVTTTKTTNIAFGNTSGYPDAAIGFARIKESSVAFLALESHTGIGRMAMSSSAGDQLLCSFDPAEPGIRLSGICSRDDGSSFDVFATD